MSHHLAPSSICWLLSASLLCLVVVSGCATDRSDTPRSIDEISENQVLLVGSVSRIIALNAPEHRTETDEHDVRDQERVLLWLEPFNTAKPPTEKLGLLVDWERVYYFGVPKVSQQISVAERAYYQNEEQVFEPLMLPKPLKYLVRVDDVAVYIGHLRLYVNEFDDVVAFEVLDEHKQAETYLREKLGANLSLRVSLLTLQD